MILPPLFGANTRSDDNSWESIRLSFESMDLLSFNKAVPLTHLTFGLVDTMNYDRRTDPFIHLTFGLIESMNYSKRTDPMIKITYGVLDVMVYSNE
jgi:hypothetical protein